MSSAVESDISSKNRKFAPEAIWEKTKKVAGKTALFGVFAASAYGVFLTVENSSDNQNKAANSEQEKSVAISLAQAGFTNIVSVEAVDGNAIVTLSSDLKDDKACRISFNVVHQEDSIGLALNDAEGRAFPSATLKRGEDAAQFMQKLC